MRKMKIEEVYGFSYDFLVGISSGIVSKSEIDTFISEPDGGELSSIDGAFELLLGILQDFQMFPNVIKYAERSREIKEAIHFPNISYCASLDPEQLAERFIKRFGASSERCWRRYCKGIVTGAQFLDGFDGFDDFKRTLDSHDRDAISREALALYLSKTISNMGFAIACNWLKELGYMNYSKPDTHMKDICLALGLIKSKNDDVGCFRAMNTVADGAGVEPYRLDKVWWLICSGNYYRINKQIPNPRINKERFLRLLEANRP